MYSASKAAVTSAGETMRLELAPLKVRVLAVNAGAVESNIHARTEKHALREDSLYRPIKNEYNKRFAPDSLMPAGKFASKVVADVQSGASGVVYREAMATTASLMKS